MYIEQFSLIVSIISLGLPLCLSLGVNVKMRMRVIDSVLVFEVVPVSCVSEGVKVVSGYPILSGVIIA